MISLETAIQDTRTVASVFFEQGHKEVFVGVADDKLAWSWEAFEAVYPGAPIPFNFKLTAVEDIEKLQADITFRNFFEE